jgi:hypothetical protein
MAGRVVKRTQVSERLFWHMRGMKMKGDILYLYHHRFVGGEEFGLYENRADAEAMCEGEDKNWAEVISMVVL